MDKWGMSGAPAFVRHNEDVLVLADGDSHRSAICNQLIKLSDIQELTLVNGSISMLAVIKTRH